MKLASSLLLSAGMGISGHLWAAACAPMPGLPGATVQNSVSFGDGLTYALPLLGIDYGSSPGAIMNCIVIATGSGGTNVNTNAAGIDNAYQTPSGTVTSNPYFRTGDSTWSLDPGSTFGAFTGQTATSWDVRLQSLSTFLNGGQMVVMFNHNQTNSGTGSADQNLFIWAQIRLVDDACVGAGGLPLSAAACTAAGGLPTKYFYVASSPSPLGLPNFGTPGNNTGIYEGPQTLPTTTYPSGADGTCPAAPNNPALTFPSGSIGFGTNTDACFMVLARGQICLNGTTKIPEACGATAGQITFNDNLGADRVANAILFPDIQAFLNDLDPTGGLFGGYDVMQADIRMGCNKDTFASFGGSVEQQYSPCPDGTTLNNGFEQIFITSSAQTICPGGVCDTPEPAPLALLGLGLVLLVGFQLRRKA
jgi:hypothetical protein